jgi:hypothetical protein
MTYQIADFVSQLDLEVGIHKAYSNKGAELTSLASALSSDTTTHDKTIENPPPALQIGLDKSRFTNDVLHLVNRGKGGNLSATQMSNAITNELSKVFPPVQTSAPAISGAGTVGSTLTCTTGNWTYAPTSYTYQWKRGVTNVGTNQNTYLTVAGDSGATITCQVTATNAAGSTPATLSNGIAVT